MAASTRIYLYFFSWEFYTFRGNSEYQLYREKTFLTAFIKIVPQYFFLYFLLHKISCFLQKTTSNFKIIHRVAVACSRCLFNVNVNWNIYMTLWNEVTTKIYLIKLTRLSPAIRKQINSSCVCLSCWLRVSGRRVALLRRSVHRPPELNINQL